MAIYRYPQFLLRVDHALFESLHAPGTVAPYSGIYRCSVCGQEIVARRDEPLPASDHHAHVVGEGAMRWQLAAAPSE